MVFGIDVSSKCDSCGEKSELGQSEGPPTSEWRPIRVGMRSLVGASGGGANRHGRWEIKIMNQQKQT
jgi:hypothetical protein